LQDEVVANPPAGIGFHAVNARVTLVDFEQLEFVAGSSSSRAKNRSVRPV
jgi:hypothetical protein